MRYRRLLRMQGGTDEAHAMSTASDPPVCPNLRISAAKATPYTHEAYQALMREISLPSRFGLTELPAF